MTEDEIYAGELASLRDRTLRAKAEIDTTTTVVNGICAAAMSPALAADIVDEVDDARGRVRLRSGEVYTLGDNAPSRAGALLGERVLVMPAYAPHGMWQ